MYEPNADGVEVQRQPGTSREAGQDRRIAVTGRAYEAFAYEVEPIEVEALRSSASRIYGPLTYVEVQSFRPSRWGDGLAPSYVTSLTLKVLDPDATHPGTATFYLSPEEARAVALELLAAADEARDLRIAGR